MTKKDKRAVAGILALAIAAGLWLVEESLDRARLRQEQIMNAAREALIAGDIDGTGETVPVPLLPQIADPIQNGEETRPPAESGSPDEIEPSISGGQETQPPRMGKKKVSIASLSQWLQTESLEAQAAQSALAQAKAVASGQGSSDDALRRNFAKTQGEDNYQAECNRLDRLAARLGNQYLLCQWNLTLKEQTLDYYKQLKTLVELREKNLQGATDVGLVTEAQVQADLQQVKELCAQAQLELEEAELELETAGQEINLAVGNPVTDPITVTDVLSIPELPKDTEVKALAAALKNRNECKEAQYQLLRAEEALTQMRYHYAPDSPEILTQQQLVAEGKLALPMLEDQLEGEIRELYSSMKLLSERLTLDEAQVEQYRKEKPAPTYQIGGDGGSNLAQLLGQWNSYVTTMGRYGADCAQLAMQVRDMSYAAGVGLVPAEI